MMDYSCNLLYDLSLGVSRAAVGQFANGVNLALLDKAAMIADYFYVSLDYLTGRSDDSCHEQYILKAEKHFVDNILYNWLPTYYKNVELREENYPRETRIAILAQLKTSENLIEKIDSGTVKAIYNDADNAFSYSELVDNTLKELEIDIPQNKCYGEDGHERFSYVLLYQELLPLLFKGNLIHRQLKALREAGKLNFSQVAEKIGLSKFDYIAYENKTVVPTSQVLSKLADFFCVTVDYLTGESEQPAVAREKREFYCRADIKKIKSSQADKKE